MSTSVLLAPAKLTWTLQVGERRSDGYHDLESEMVSIDLCDDVVITEPGNGLTLSSDSEPGFEDLVLGADNLVHRALVLCGRRASVELTKRIPMGGGLGGGSSDAAAILRWAGFSDLVAAGGLGGDVPFCVAGGRAMVRGLGERVEPLDHVDRTVLLLLPPVAVATPSAYRALDELRAEGAGHHPRNDLTEAAFRVAPELRVWFDAFSATTGVEAILAGSGSTLFVEGSARDLGCEGMERLAVGELSARVLEARTIPAAAGNTAR
jgi:4-diphosphocytidyl-2-C-methyl-D-erythritol kinase